MQIALLVVTVLIVFAGTYVLATYNKFVALKNRVKEGLERYLKNRRFQCKRIFVKGDIYTVTEELVKLFSNTPLFLARL
ncbi:MAG: hypothetical protein LBS61_03115 [Endomicrobium sp.]|jgi:hypothetical protein|nr:hypothetical protein [Endomicrobium sp.]